jgi:hypothetical protein
VRVAYLAGAGCLLYVALLGVSFAGGPIGPHSLLPVPGVPHKVAGNPLVQSGLGLLGADDPTGDGTAAPAAQPTGTGRTATPKPSASARHGAAESLVRVTPGPPASTGPPAGPPAASPTPTPAATTPPPVAPTTPPASPPAPTDSPSTESAPTPPAGGTGPA